MPWSRLDPRFSYGSLLLCDEPERELHLRLRVPRTADSARELERVIFEQKRWPATGVVAEEHPLLGETTLLAY